MLTYHILQHARDLVASLDEFDIDANVLVSALPDLPPQLFRRIAVLHPLSSTFIDRDGGMLDRRLSFGVRLSVCQMSEIVNVRDLTAQELLSLETAVIQKLDLQYAHNALGIVEPFRVKSVSSPRKGEANSKTYFFLDMSWDVRYCTPPQMTTNPRLAFSDASMVTGTTMTIRWDIAGSWTTSIEASALRPRVFVGSPEREVGVSAVGTPSVGGGKLSVTVTLDDTVLSGETVAITTFFPWIVSTTYEGTGGKLRGSVTNGL